MAFVRFVVRRPDDESKMRLGVIKAANEMKKLVPASVEEELRGLLAWFDRHLPEPDRFSQSSGERVDSDHGVCWFKDSATNHIARLRLVIEILRNWGERVEMLTTERPGHVVYEDEFQVVAVQHSAD